MVFTTSRPSVRPSTTLPHTHTNPLSPGPRAKFSTSHTPLAQPSRASASVGHAMPPNPKRAAPGGSENVRPSSPNYFALAVDSTNDPHDSNVGPRGNWSPPTSSIRSFATPSSQRLPLDANPEFEAFRRQSEANNTFSLGRLAPGAAHGPMTPGLVGSRAPGGEHRASRSRDEEGVVSPRMVSSEQMDGPRQPPQYFDFPRQESPAMTLSPPARRTMLYLDERHPRLSLPSNRADLPSPPVGHQEAPHRADTLPSALEDGPLMLSSARLKELFDNTHTGQLLLLDLRVAPQYALSRVRGALNLCIPTTLLKRPSFNLAKLTDTFKIDEERARFAHWSECQYIIVYDARSREKKDAIAAVNTIKKFTNEGWHGQAFVLRGGIEDFARAYPHLIDQHPAGEAQSSKRNLSLDSGVPAVAPVAGGCEMPGSRSAANPFFSNIRQNMDLLGGVGQIDLQRPDSIDPRVDSFVPAWLRTAAAVEDRGQMVASKFLHIEQDELQRMQKALSTTVTYATPGTATQSTVQIAGFEKGGKNRYNNIWPFEHARVRLQGRLEGECDYVNASHIKARWSNKRYIASQGPLPATFEDFWSVVWDQDVRVIVMLTAESEGGQLKCHPYWAGKEYGEYRLKALSEKRVSLDPDKPRRSSGRHESGRQRRDTNSQLTLSPAEASSEPASDHEPYVIVRKFTLSHSAEPFTPMREVTQLHYSSWPDFGAPAQPKHLLALVELANSLQRLSMSPARTSQSRAEEPESSLEARPLLVHCSAGCGRTGTFCTVDSVIDMLKRQRSEHKSGVTPMELSTPAKGDYLSMGRPHTENESDWIFEDGVDLVQKTVEEFRKQRISMVQTLRQYVLCYETVLEWIGQQRRSRKNSEA